MNTISIRKTIAILSVIILGLSTSCKDKNDSTTDIDDTEITRDEVNAEGQNIGTEADTVTLDTITSDTEY